MQQLSLFLWIKKMKEDKTEAESFLELWKSFIVWGESFPFSFALRLLLHFPRFCYTTVWWKQKEQKKTKKGKKKNILNTRRGLQDGKKRNKTPFTYLNRHQSFG